MFADTSEVTYKTPSSRKFLVQNSQKLYTASTWKSRFSELSCEKRVDGDVCCQPLKLFIKQWESE